MRLAVNPTRMELLRLRKRLQLARRGHKLLKDKRDELMKRFMGLVHQIKELRLDVEKELEEAWKRFLVARSVGGAEVIETAVSVPTRKTFVEVERDQIMNVVVPVFTLKTEGKLASYGLATTPAELDTSLVAMEKVLGRMVELASKEKALELIGDEIERTRRRVNALEYVLIPNLLETIRYISMKLSEMERGNLTRLMRVKEMVRDR
ncbi:MAG: V-type ATP synthase subunit D [Candidatus Eisenbacteria bacterium]